MLANDFMALFALFNMCFGRLDEQSGHIVYTPADRFITVYVTATLTLAISAYINWVADFQVHVFCPLKYIQSYILL